MKSIESQFIPLLVYNNKGGRDAELLKKYKEPAWNFPVVRFVDGRGHDLLDRQDRIYTVEGIRKRMKRALALAPASANKDNEP